ncbi:hypothetical protein [Solicola sp. PLA-1-18]|uniref:hypothetical protein n=1 Tax=Solicola sp. PLA-1-18 TaxID=3380532 RepID=UPI003B7A5067
MAIWSPLDGAVSIRLSDEEQQPSSFEPRHDPRRPGSTKVVGGHPVHVTEELVVDPAGVHSYTSIALAAPALGGSLLLDGPRTDVRAIADTAQLVPDAYVAVPNVLMGVEPADPLTSCPQPDEAQARVLLDRAGLRLRGAGVVTDVPGGDLGSDPADLFLVGTIPTGGSVVSRGTSVALVFATPWGPRRSVDKWRRGR